MTSSPPAESEFLYRLTLMRPEVVTNGPTPEEDAVIARHFAYLSGLAEAGTVVLAGRTLDPERSVFGIVVFRAADETAARTIMEKDPALAENLMNAELHPFRIALMGR